MIQMSYRIFPIFTRNKDFRAIEISRLVCNYNSSSLKFIRAHDEEFFTASYSKKSKSKYVYKKPNLPSHHPPTKPRF